ncbi:MAG: DNA repair protein RadC [Bacilli bacterium]|nr:DNA repair protein RadC [Bacilli bacterium]
MKIKDLPKNEMPRERLLQYGVENLSNIDLLSIILRTGIKDISVRELSADILNSVGSLNNLADAGIRELSNIKGMGSVKAITLIAAVELGKRISSQEISLHMKLSNVELVHNAFKKYFINLKQEKFIAIYLDNKKCLISYKVLSIGTIDKTIVHPRDVFNEAIKVSASSIIVMHNHPSSDITPSKEDIDTTNRLVETGLIMNIPIIDHIITNGKDYYSFYDNHFTNN